MKILRLDNTAQPPVAVPGRAPIPKPAKGELLIKVFAAGLTPTELSWYPTSHTRTGAARTSAVPGHEFSGVVTAVGEDVGSLEIGHDVFGMNDWYSNGAMAEYCTAPFFAVAPKRPSLTHVEAASVPISALTAWQALFDHAKLQPGERVLIHGGAGSVGAFAIQFAYLHGARVTTTVSARDFDFVSGLGAEQVIDYRKSPFENRVKGMDIVFDTVGGDTLERSWRVLQPGGRLVTVVSTAEGSTDPRIQKAFFIVEPNRKQLVEVGALLDSGKVQPVVDTVIPLSQAPEAYAGKVPKLGRGKLVVAVTELDEKDKGNHDKN